MDIIWEEPTRGGAGAPQSEAWTELIEACRKNPGKWARHEKEFSGSGWQAARSALSTRGWGRTDFEVKTQKTEGKKSFVFIRYIGA